MPPNDRPSELEDPHLVTGHVACIELEERADGLEKRGRIRPVGLGTMGQLAELWSLDRASATDDGGQSVASIRRTRSARAWRTAVLTVGKSSIS